MHGIRDSRGGPARRSSFSQVVWEMGLARISQVLVYWRFRCDLDSSLRSPGALVAVDPGRGPSCSCSSGSIGGVAPKGALGGAPPPGPSPAVLSRRIQDSGG